VISGTWVVTITSEAAGVALGATDADALGATDADTLGATDADGDVDAVAEADGDPDGATLEVLVMLAEQMTRAPPPLADPLH
jgi:hypothetical protein